MKQDKNDFDELIAWLEGTVRSERDAGSTSWLRLFRRKEPGN